MLSFITISKRLASCSGGMFFMLKKRADKKLGVVTPAVKSCASLKKRDSILIKKIVIFRPWARRISSVPCIKILFICVFSGLVQKLQFMNNFDLRMMEFAAVCGKFRETCERTNAYRTSPVISGRVKPCRSRRRGLVFGKYKAAI
jgi:hypothetical protein